MKSRFSKQMSSLCVLVILPVSMILFNGKEALQAIFYRQAESKLVTLSIDHKPKTKVEFTTVQPPKNKSPGRSCRLTFGAYDPTGELSDHNNLKIQHLYISWTQFDHKELLAGISKAEAAGRQILLTVEPWPNRDDQADTLLEDVTQGVYDESIDRVAEVLSESTVAKYVSWGHEMDQDLTERYPWSGKDPQKFIAAYRYVIDRIRKSTEADLSFVWVGVLKDTSVRYWPGDEYVDFIGMPVYSFPSWDQQTYGFIRDFRTTFEEKQNLIVDLDKPLMITEMGVAGSSDFESFWLHQAFLALDDYPRLTAVIFFYASDTEGAWGKNYPTPDWRVHPEAIRGLVDWKKTD
ncbi:glycoside hydrolase family 26 protein [Fuerstiella marisgermanici]|uniref:Endoglucanase H n=1 Tax=Fuerstiella marisgermanici TaxID=1891926 RepID=A0A1P8WQS7_9PLAN|nr:glycosyl hydrolase [Fuerstiella marisgermanici]APZ96410.1 Endoglucanase H precursor [Fuerstiella marisgermanici]